MDKDRRKKAIEILAEAQETCAPVIVRIGGVSKGGIVDHGALGLIEAPAFAVNALIEAGFTLSADNGAVEVEWLR